MLGAAGPHEVQVWHLSQGGGSTSRWNEDGDTNLIDREFWVWWWETQCWVLLTGFRVLGFGVLGFGVLGHCSEGPPVRIIVATGAALNVDLHRCIATMVDHNVCAT